MACNCAENSLGNTQQNLVAWVMPSGCGPRNEMLYAMIDSGEWPGIKVTGVQNNRRGARTPILRRSGRDPRRSKRCGVQEAAAAANSITLEVEACGCGGLDYSELVDCELDIFEYESCCGAAGDEENNWTKIKHWRGIDIENDQYANRVSFDTNDANTLSITHTAEFADAHTYYEIGFSEIAELAGLATGAYVTDLVFTDNENCGGSGCGRRVGCGEQWYAVTDTGDIIYKPGAGDPLASVTIAGFVASDSPYYTRIGLYRNRLYVVTSSAIGNPLNVYVADIDQASGIPGAFTLTLGPTDVRPLGFLEVRNDFWLFGQDAVAGNAATVYEVMPSGALENIFLSVTPNTGLLSADSCDSSVVLGGSSGTVYQNSGCSDALELLPAPAATDIWSVGIRTDNEIWVGGADGNLYWTDSDGQIWNTVTLPVNGIIFDIKWATPCVGYLVTVVGGVGGVAEFYTTWNGGATWTNTTDRLSGTPTTFDDLTRIRIPCCNNGTAQVNNAMIIGGDGTTGGIYEASIQNC